VIDKITVPSLIVHAAMIILRILPRRGRNRRQFELTFIETKDGGHCAFLGSRSGQDGGFWAESQIGELPAQSFGRRRPILSMDADFSIELGSEDPVLDFP